MSGVLTKPGATEGQEGGEQSLLMPSRTLGPYEYCSECLGDHS